MKEIPISEFKANCVPLLKQVQVSKKPISVTRFGEPLAIIMPAAPQPKPADWIGSMKGEIEILGDIVSPANEESEWEALRD